MSTIIQLRIVIVLLRWFTTAINLLLQSIHASHHQFQHLVHLSRHSFNFFYGECRVVNYCRVWFCATITVTTARFGFAQQKPLQRRVWFCATITVTTARLVLRNKNRYNGAFGFAQQLPLQRRVWFCATIKVSLFSTFEEKCRRPQ